MLTAETGQRDRSSDEAGHEPQNCWRCRRRKPRRKAIQRPEHNTDEACVAYVAMTRARNRGRRPRTPRESLLKLRSRGQEFRIRRAGKEIAAGVLPNPATELENDKNK
jgi:hypothetical protein